jgi:hypothetical protein
MIVKLGVFFVCSKKMKQRLREHLLLSVRYTRKRSGLVIKMKELQLRFVKPAFILHLGISLFSSNYGVC